MNIQAILNVVGVMLILLSGLLLAPLGVSFYYGDLPLEGYISETSAFCITCTICLLTGLILWKLFPSGIEKLRDREGFAIVATSWMVMSAFGAFPLYLTGICPNYIDALFESTSGFTTTGASILVNIDSVSHGILFWRNLMQWVGGMGIILLSLAIFPMLGIGSFHLFKAEIPGGSTVEQMQPRLAETAKILWKTYLALTVIEITALLFAGLDLFDAVCHTFSTVATGGFSPHNGSVGVFDNIYIEAIIILFMFFGGINFALHSQIVRGNFAGALKNPEFRSYCSILIIGILLVTWGLTRVSPDGHAGEAFRNAAFTVVSIQTTTGFVTDDFNLWPEYLKLLILGIMMVGGCSGSTSGSFKIIRFIILIKIILRELAKLVHPRAIFHVKVGEKTISPDDLSNVAALTFLFIGISALSAMMLSFMGVDLTTAISASIASLFNIGPGLGAVGAMGNYATIPAMGKGILISCMLLGRLEIYGILLLILPIAWRK
ncbi:MAG: potassium transporter membrane component TrkH [Nitrospina sp.]|nr:potassium transporter membrane component TrkH [Nitrospina sp.]